MFSIFTRTALRGRHWLLVGIHLLAFALTFALATLLRFDFEPPPIAWAIYIQAVPWVASMKLMLFYLLSHYHGWWRFVTFADLLALLRASLASLVVLAVLDWGLFPKYQIPRSVLLLDCGLTILLLGGMRSFRRILAEGRRVWGTSAGYRRALVVGVDQATGALSQMLQSDARLKIQVVGFLDQSPASTGSLIGGLPVLGSLGDLDAVLASLRCDDVLVRDDCLSGQQLRDLLRLAEKHAVRVRILPPLETVIHGTRGIRQLRNIDINDLLRREPVELDGAAIAGLVRGKVVLVTGAGGSIGSEICRQLLRFHPARLVLVERFENNLFLIDQELRQASDVCPLAGCIADVTDRPRMRGVFDVHRPDVVFHAAAHKHVPLMEHNPGEAIKNNVFGTQVVAELADEFHAGQFVLISTDKAVHPSSVMGATKQVAERVIYALSQRSATRFVAVRFGNVLGSAGSVIPVFQEQIRRGGPITVTHPEMERFFMTIPEASQLVLQAAAIGRGGEIFVLDMGQPVKIVDLARDLLRLQGLTTDDVAIEFTGVRPGEKLSEVLYFDDEELLPAAHPKIRVVCQRRLLPVDLEDSLECLRDAIDRPADVVRQMLQQVVPEFDAPPAAASALPLPADPAGNAVASSTGVV